MNKTKLNKLAKLALQKTLSPDEHVEVLGLMGDLEMHIADKEVVVPDPDDYPENDEVKIWKRAELIRMPEKTLVKLAKELGIDATIKDTKAKTATAIINAQK